MARALTVRRLVFATGLLAALLLSAIPARAAVITVEPDDYAAGTALTTVSPYVTLHTLDSRDQVVPMFTVTSAAGDRISDDLSPTGSLVFAHFGIPFFNTIRKLQADFNGRTSSVSIAFAGGSVFATDVARLEAYDESGALLDAVVSPPTPYLQFGALSLTRPTADIARVVIYATQGEFTRFDALAFETPVPEPSGALTALGVLGAAALVRRRTRTAG